MRFLQYIESLAADMEFYIRIKEGLGVERGNAKRAESTCPGYMTVGAFEHVDTCVHACVFAAQDVSTARTLHGRDSVTKGRDALVSQNA
jgi:hypothetical protein